MAGRLISRWRGGVFAFPLAAAAAFGVLLITEASYREASQSFARLGDRGQARIDIQTLRRSLYEAESGQRGYLLTARAEYLAQYRKALPDVASSLAALKAFYGSDAVSAVLIEQIAAATEAKLSELQQSIAVHDQGRHEAWRELLLSNIGKEKMEEARLLIDRLLALESSRVQLERESVQETLALNRIGVAAITAVSLLALFMYLRQKTALDQKLIEEAERTATERERLESEVVARTAQLKELAQHLQTVREDERNRLARELHDELGALLTAAKLDVARLKSRLGTTVPESLERLAHLNEQLNNGIALKRRIIEDLRPSSLSNLGLVAALEILLREFVERSDIEVVKRLEPVELDPAAQLTVYRLVQEALTNIVKYAKAKRIDVRLGLGPTGSALVSVRDDGVGFDTELPRAAKHGLIGMRYRVEAAGGTMRLESAPGKGTLIEAALPTPRSAPTRPSPTAESGHEADAFDAPAAAG